MKYLHKILNTFKQLPTSWYLFLTLLLAAAIRLINLTRSDIWHDEGYTAMVIKLPPGEIIATAVNDVHPPLYYLLMHWWQLLFGNSAISLRGFSVVCGVLAIIGLYLILRRLFNEPIARLGAFLAAIGPFLVRYSQEARMYSLAALIAVFATYVFIRAISQKKAWGWWLVYGVLIAAGLYTQYFLGLIVVVHLFYAAWHFKGGFAGVKKTLLLPGIWLGGITAVLLFAPWIKTLIAQVTRVDDGFWIPPVDWFSIPNTLSMFTVYSHDLTKWLGVTFVVALIAASIWLSKRYPKYRPGIWLLAAWTFVPMIIIALLSLKSPVFYDRYFTYSAPAFYGLLAVIIALLPFKKSAPAKRIALGSTLVALLMVGILTIYSSYGHKMGSVANYVNQQHQPGDQIISAEIYTFFDFSFYSQTNTPVYLLSATPFGHYGEWGLVRHKNVPRIENLNDATAEQVWVVGKTGEHSYFTDDIPKNWTLLSSFEAGDSAVRHYRLP